MMAVTIVSGLHTLCLNTAMMNDNQYKIIYTIKDRRLGDVWIQTKEAFGKMRRKFSIAFDSTPYDGSDYCVWSSYSLFEYCHDK